MTLPSFFAASMTFFQSSPAGWAAAGRAASGVSRARCRNERRVTMESSGGSAAGMMEPRRPGRHDTRRLPDAPGRRAQPARVEIAMPLARGTVVDTRQRLLLASGPAKGDPMSDHDA